MGSHDRSVAPDSVQEDLVYSRMVLIWLVETSEANSFTFYLFYQWRWKNPGDDY